MKEFGSKGHLHIYILDEVDSRMDTIETSWMNVYQRRELIICAVLKLKCKEFCDIPITL